MVKWGIIAESNQAAERVNGFIARIVGSRALYALIVLASFVLLTGAGDKWGS